VGEQLIADNLTPGAQFGNGAAEIDGVPEDDGGEGKIEADFPRRKDGRPHGRPTTVGNKVNEMKKLARKGLSKSAIARQLNVGRTSVRRLLAGT
jgi:helix-turn-helix resolvase-like protein